MSDPDLEKAVLGIVLQPNYKPVKPRALAHKLGLDEDDARDLKRAIKRLVKQGLLAYGANHLVGPPVAANQQAIASPASFAATTRDMASCAPPAGAPAPIARRTSTSPPKTAAMPLPATRCWCG